MGQLRNPGQGQPAAVVGPALASAMLLMGLVFALIGIKLFGFRRRLTFDRSQVQQQQGQQAQLPPPRYAAFESQVNGTDSAVHGVFRSRNLEEFESPWPSASAPATATGNNYMTGSVPNLRLYGASPRETRTRDGSKVAYREKSLEQRRRRLEVNSERYEYPAPPTRQPPSPPRQPERLDESQPGDSPAASLESAPSATLPRTYPEVPKSLPLIAPLNQSLPAANRDPLSEPPSELGMPNFDHFAEKYALISVKPSGEGTGPTQLRNKDSGRYVKFDPVDDVPELLTPEDTPPEPLTPDDGLEGALSVIAQVHRGAIPKEEPEPEPERTINPLEEPGIADSAFVVEIIAGSPEAETTPRIQPPVQSGLFDDLELPLGSQDMDFQRIRSSFVIHEADILDVDQLQLPPAGSPPGFGKSIDEDWENFANLDAVADVPEPNWALHPNSLDVETTLSEATLTLDNVEQVEGLFHQLELLEPRSEIFEPEPEPEPLLPCVEPPPYDPGFPYLPDYDSLMQLERSRGGHNLPNYTEVMEQRSKKANYVSRIEDLYEDLEASGVEVARSPSTAQSNGVHNFEELCEEMAVVTPSPPRQAPQPAPRSTRPAATLNVRGDAPPLACYQPGELPSSSSSDADEEDAARSAPQPARRDPKALKVRFDVDNLQYYQSAEVVTSSGGESDEDDDDLPRPTPMQRSIVFEPTDNGLPSLFGTQVSQEDSDDDDDGFGRAISQHRSMTAALRTHTAVRSDTEA